MNITSKPQPERFAGSSDITMCRQNADGVGTDVFPTLQGTGMNFPEHFLMPHGEEYIVIRWYNDAETLVLFTVG